MQGRLLPKLSQADPRKWSALSAWNNNRNRRTASPVMRKENEQVKQRRSGSQPFQDMDPFGVRSQQRDARCQLRASSPDKVAPTWVQ